MSQRKAAGLIAEKRVGLYFDPSIYTWNPLKEPEDHVPIRKPDFEHHPSNKSLDEIFQMNQEDTDLDYIELVNTLKRHQNTSCCSCNEKKN